MEPLATLEDLKDRLDWTLDEDEERIAEAALEDLSDDARMYGRESWTTPQTAPRTVSKLVLRAAARFLRNPDGYTTSRAGDETLSWNEDKSGQAGSPHFNAAELRALKQLAGQTILYTAPMTVWGKMRPRDDVGWVPTGGTDRGFPMYSSSTEPW